MMDVHMHRPTTNSKHFTDALGAFWPGLQVKLANSWLIDKLIESLFLSRPSGKACHLLAD